MAAHNYAFFECTSPTCRLRFPAERSLAAAGTCPICQTPTRPSPANPALDAPPFPATSPSFRLDLFLDNIRSVHNVGSIFRTADGAGVDTLHLAGITPTPAHKKLQKTALGAGSMVKWQQTRNGPDLADQLKQQGANLWALELTPQSINLTKSLPAAHLPSWLVLVIGNEVTGVDPALLERCERHLGLPMVGSKESLNVTIACGIAVYTLLHGQPNPNSI